jgi:hypothetical protein
MGGSRMAFLPCAGQHLFQIIKTTEKIVNTDSKTALASVVTIVLVTAAVLATAVASAQ